MKRALLILALLGAPQVAVAEPAERATFPEFTLAVAPVTWEETTLTSPTPELTTPVGTPWRGFAKGQCTDWVSRQRLITFRGHARDWPKNALRAGYTLGDTPIVGAVLVTRESRWGHVSYVEKVLGDGSFVVSEWNVAGRYRLTHRTFRLGDPRIVVFIY